MPCVSRVQANRRFAVLESKPQLQLQLTLDVPKSFDQLVYFVRDPNKLVTKENIGQVRPWHSVQ